MGERVAMMHGTGGGHARWDEWTVPQVGGGVTCAIAENLRLMAGLRWYHLSNAQPNSTNPGVDMLEAYVGLTFSF